MSTKRTNLPFNDFRKKVMTLSGELVELVDNLYRKDGIYRLIDEDEESTTLMIAVVIVRVGVEVFASSVYDNHKLMRLYLVDDVVKASTTSDYPIIQFKNHVISIDDNDGDIITCYEF